jgi:hypothetical protein
MVTLSTDEPLAGAAVEAIHAGDLLTLKRLLQDNPGLATARLGDDDPGGMSRTLLHVATDWPGHFPNGAAMEAALIAAGADVNARFTTLPVGFHVQARSASSTRIGASVCGSVELITASWPVICGTPRASTAHIGGRSGNSTRCRVRVPENGYATATAPDRSE